MGKRLKQQRRGKGSNAYAKPTTRFKADVVVKMPKAQFGEVIDFIDDPGHSAPLMLVRYNDNTISINFAPEGIRIGDRITINDPNNIKLGSIMQLKNIPDGYYVHNIERSPGDGGAFARGSGTYAIILSHENGKVNLMLPSKKSITLPDTCTAEIGVVAGGGMKAEPIMKAGKNYYIMHARNMLWPRYRGVKMNAVDHPFGGKQHHKGTSSMVSRNAPPGAKVGHIAARRVGRKKRG